MNTVATVATAPILTLKKLTIRRLACCVSLLERGLQIPMVRTIVKLATLDVRPSVMIRRMECILGLTYGRTAQVPIAEPKKR